MRSIEGSRWSRRTARTIKSPTRRGRPRPDYYHIWTYLIHYYHIWTYLIQVAYQEGSAEAFQEPRSLPVPESFVTTSGSRRNSLAGSSGLRGSTGEAAVPASFISRDGSRRGSLSASRRGSTGSLLANAKAQLDSSLSRMESRAVIMFYLRNSVHIW